VGGGRRSIREMTERASFNVPIDTVKAALVKSTEHTEKKSRMEQIR